MRSFVQGLSLLVAIPNKIDKKMRLPKSELLAHNGGVRDIKVIGAHAAPRPSGHHPNLDDALQIFSTAHQARFHTARCK